MAITDDIGDVVRDYTYDVYGQVTGGSGATPNEFDFAGQQSDDSTGLQYLRARYYDATAGVFLSRDPVATTPAWLGSSHGYVDGNPTNLVDPTGLWPNWCQLINLCWRQITFTDVFWLEELHFGDRPLDRFRICQFVGEYKDCGTSTYTAGYLKDHLEELVMPALAVASTVINAIDVMRLGRAGSSERIREVRGGENDARSLFQQLAKGGQRTSSTYPGEMVVLKNGTRIGFRKTSTSGPPTIDIHIPGQRPIEIKFLP